jgi:hypothetical protein
MMGVQISPLYEFREFIRAVFEEYQLTLIVPKSMKDTMVWVHRRAELDCLLEKTFGSSKVRVDIAEDGDCVIRIASKMTGTNVRDCRKLVIGM